MKRTVKRMVKRLLGRSLPGRAGREAPNDPKSPSQSARRRVWRITERAPQGEWIDPAEAAALGGQVHPEPGSRSWNAASLDLLQGTEVTEFSQDTLPSAFYDDSFEPPAPPAPRVPHKRS